MQTTFVELSVSRWSRSREVQTNTTKNQLADKKWRGTAMSAARDSESPLECCSESAVISAVTNVVCIILIYYFGLVKLVPFQRGSRYFSFFDERWQLNALRGSESEAHEPSNPRYRKMCHWKQYKRGGRVATLSAAQQHWPLATPWPTAFARLPRKSARSPQLQPDSTARARSHRTAAWAAAGTSLPATSFLPRLSSALPHGGPGPRRGSQRQARLTRSLPRSGKISTWTFPSLHCARRCVYCRAAFKFIACAARWARTHTTFAGLQAGTGAGLEAATGALTHARPA